MSFMISRGTATVAAGLALALVAPLAPTAAAVRVAALAPPPDRAAAPPAPQAAPEPPTLPVLAEELASRGYVVAAVDHGYESVGTEFPGGRMLTWVACEAAEDMAAVAEGRAADLSFVLDQLTGPRPAWRHAGLIDTSRI